MKPFLLVAFAFAFHLAAPAAHADARLKACQAQRRLITDSKSCPDQAAIASRTTCGPATYGDMSALERACFDHRTHDFGQRCVITKIGNRDVTLDVPVYHKYDSEGWCKTAVRPVAEKWLAEHSWCPAGRTTFPMTFTWGTHGHEVTLYHTGYCPIARR